VIRSFSEIRWHLLAWSALTAVGVLLYLQSYERWGDPTIDLGRDLYLPSQLLNGHVLYRNELYNYGPIAPYLLAGIVALFGDRLVVFEMVGILVGLGTMVALYGVGLAVGPGGGGGPSRASSRPCSFSDSASSRIRR